MSDASGANAMAGQLVSAAAARRVPLHRQLLRNRKVVVGLFLTLPVLIMATLGPWIAPYDFTALRSGPPLEGPTVAHPFGTDYHGRDMLSRIIAGAATSMRIAAIVGLFTLLIAIPLGLLVGYVGGWIDALLMRIVDILLAFPWLLVGLAMASMLGPGEQTVIVALVIVYSPQLARFTRNTVMAVRHMDYVQAGEAIGESQVSLMVRYVLSNAYFPILVLLTAMLAATVLNESGISYLGFGVQSPSTSWGLELALSAQYVAMGPHLAIFPGIFIAITVLGLNLLGDGLGDVFADISG